jgi:hypothetical protein
MPTESFPIAPTALSVPLHSYGMLAYHRRISDFGFPICEFQNVFVFFKSAIGNPKSKIRQSETSVRGLSPVILSAQGCLTSELLRFL